MRPSAHLRPVPLLSTCAALTRRLSSGMAGVSSLSTSPRLCREKLLRNCNPALSASWNVAYCPETTNSWQNRGLIIIISRIEFVDVEVFGGFIYSCSVQYILRISSYCKMYLLVSNYRCKKERTKRTESEKAQVGVCNYSHICGYIDTGISLLWYNGHSASQWHFLSCSDNTWEVNILIQQPLQALFSWCSGETYVAILKQGAWKAEYFLAPLKCFYLVIKQWSLPKIL